MNRYKRTCRQVGAALLVFAALVRGMTACGLDQKLGQAARRTAVSRPFVSFLTYLELGRVGTWPDQTGADKPAAQTEAAPAAEPPLSAAETSVPETSVPETSAAPAQETAASETPAPATDGVLAAFTAADAAGIAIGGKCTYPVDKKALLLAPGKLDFSDDGPKVLIVHTHTSEAYTPEAGWEYAASDTLRSEDPKYTVVAVGNAIADALEKKGISVIHDTSFNDYPSYNGAYARTLTKIESWVKLYPSIQMVLDVHRDAADDANGNPVAYTAKVNGTECAQVMLVMGTDEGGLEHPHWQDNLSWALKLQAVLNRESPGLCRDVDLRTERFNQQVTRGSMLAEFGSTGNTLRQAVAAGRVFGGGLADLIAAQKSAGGS